MPDTSRFKDALVKSLERLERVLEVKIPTALDTARLAAQAVTAKRTLQDKLGSVDTRVNLDTTRAEAQIGQATRDRAVTIRAKVDEGPLARLAAIAGSAVRFAALATSIGLAANSATQLVAALIPAAGAILALPAAMAVTRAATATLKVGLSGVGEAMGAVAEGDATKLAEAMKDLSPSARAFVLEAARLKDAFEPVRQAVQQRLFQGLAGSLRTMAGNLLPTVKTGMVGVSGALNGMAKQAMATMSTPMFKGDLRKIFSGTTQVLNTFKGAIGPLITLVTRLAIAGLPLVKRFASWASSGIKAAAAFVTSERGAAKLAGIVKRAGDTLAQLGRIAANIGGFLASFFRGANADGAGLLATIERLTARMSAWASSTQGQQQIANVFATLGQTASALGGILPILVGPLTAIAGIITSLPPGVQGTVTQFLAWSVVIGALGGKIWSLITGIGTLVSGIGKIGPAVAKIGSGAVWFAGLAAAAGRAAVSVVAAAGRMALSLAAASASFVASAARMVASMAVTAARVAAGWVLMGVQAMAQAVRMAAAWVIAMGPIGWVIAAVIALVALIVANWDTIKAAISAAWEWIKQKTAEVWNAITSFLAGLWNGIKSLFTTYLNAVRTVVMTVWNAIRSATSSVWNGITSFFSGLWNGIKSLFTAYLNAVRTVVMTVWNGIRSATSSVWNGIKSAVTSAINGVKSIITSVLNAIKSAWSTAWNTARTLVTTAWSRIKTAVSTAISALLGLVRGIPGRITSALGSLGSLLYNAGRNVIQGLINGIKGMIGSVGSAMKNIAAKIREYLPFSPAKAGPLKIHPPDKAGRTIAAMLAGGIDSGQHLVARAASGLASATLPNVADHLSDPETDGESSGGARFVIHNHYPQAEPTSKTTNRALQYAAALGVV